MNNQRRSELKSVSKTLDALKTRVESISETMSSDEINIISEELEELRCRVESVREDEQCAFDSLPESFQYSEKGETMEGYISELDDIESSISDAISNIEDIVEDIEDVDYADARLIYKDEAISNIEVAINSIANCL